MHEIFEYSKLNEQFLNLIQEESEIIPFRFIKSSGIMSLDNSNHITKLKYLLKII